LSPVRAITLFPGSLSVESLLRVSWQDHKKSRVERKGKKSFKGKQGLINKSRWDALLALQFSDEARLIAKIKRPVIE
jgi:hypothetical protein